jgi:WD40 repeat protein
MDDHASRSDAAGGPREGGSKGWRTGRIGLVVRSQRRLVVLLALTLLLPWLPWPRSVSAVRPTYRVPAAAGATIVGLAFGPDARTLAALDEHGLVTLCDAARDWSTQRSFLISGHAKGIVPTPDGRYFAWTYEEPDVVLYDPNQGGRSRPLGMPIRHVSDLKVSPDGRTVAVSSFDSPDILLWDIDSGRARMTLRAPSPAVIRLAFAPDGRSLASAAVGEGSIRIWDLANGRLERCLTGLRLSILSLAYSPGGRLLAAASTSERPARIWDVRTGDEVLAVGRHWWAARALAFSPDGRLLGTASGDGTASLWSVADGRELRRLDGQADALRSIAFSPDGKALAASGNDGDIRLWDLHALIRHGE